MDGKCTTKDLARKLGLLKRRSSTLPNLCASSTREKLRKEDQIFKYLVVLDFESTCWKDKNNSYSPEIIEFPAVLLNLRNGEIEDRFQYYIQPRERKRLSDFCKELTGITQEQVDAGIPLKTCLKLFTDWINKHVSDKLVCFPSKTVQQAGHHKCIFATWSDWDLNVCLHYECKRKGFTCPTFLKSWIDLRGTYRNFYGRSPKGLNGALSDLGIEFKGREHSGIDDAINTAHLAWRMVRDGCVMKATKSLLMLVSEINNSRCPSETSTKGHGVSTDYNVQDEKHSKAPVANASLESLISPIQTSKNICAKSATKPDKAYPAHTKLRTDPLIDAKKNFRTPSPLCVEKTSSVTPPLCQCGRRCKRKRVVNPGPNTGRVFYTCPKSTCSPESCQGCKFFQWERSVKSTAFTNRTNRSDDITPKICNNVKNRVKVKEHYSKLFGK